MWLFIHLTKQKKKKNSPTREHYTRSGVSETNVIGIVSFLCLVIKHHGNSNCWVHIFSVDYRKWKHSLHFLLQNGVTWQSAATANKTPHPSSLHALRGHHGGQVFNNAPAHSSSHVTQREVRGRDLRDTGVGGGVVPLS